MRIGFLLGPLQGKLLTVREERTVRRLGRSEPVGIAVLAATNEDLERAVRASGGSRRRCTTGFPW
jgi:transcriptional regulator with PAS, ATPase and Fis domain